MKGRLYRGHIHPGPTALILATQSSTTSGNQPEAPPHLKVVGITDEYATLVSKKRGRDCLSAEGGEDLPMGKKKR